MVYGASMASRLVPVYPYRYLAHCRLNCQFVYRYRPAGLSRPVPGRSHTHGDDRRPDFGGALFHSIITSSIQAVSTPGEAFWHGGSLSFRIGTVLNDKAMKKRERFYTEQFLLHRCTCWNGVTSCFLPKRYLVLLSIEELYR
jgi:hypothetical protein